MGKKNEATQGMTYESVGVNYGDLDPFKVLAQQAAQQTWGNLRFHRGIAQNEHDFHGESAQVIPLVDRLIVHVNEGLGTKNLATDDIYLNNERSYYAGVAQDTVAMIVNDLITIGALPMLLAMHLAVGSSDWFKDERRAQDLVEGWKRACDLARCTWGGGETPALRGVVMPKTFLLAGSAIGQVYPKSNLMHPSHIRDGDAIVIIESSGIHANGLTMAREIAELLPRRYGTIVDGTDRTYGDLLLAPTRIYVDVLAECFARGIVPHYGVNITGHGWRKFMRSQDPYAYVIDTMPKVNPLFSYMCEWGKVELREAYSTFNMGAGFAFYTAPADADAIVSIANELGHVAFRSGYIEQAKSRRVVIRPVGLEFYDQDLALR